MNLTFSYPRWQINPTDIWQYIYPAGYLLMLACAWLWREKIGRAAAVTILFFAGMLLPMLGFFSLFTFLYSFVADHYQYAASIGPIALAAAGGTYVFRRLGSSGKFIMLSAAGALLLTLGVLTWRQSRIYTNAETLWEDTLNKNPDSWLAHGQIGKIRLKQGRLDEALMHMNRRQALASYTIAINPNIIATGYCELAIISEAQGKLDDAVNYYQKALYGFSEPANAIIYYNLGKVFAKEGKVELATENFHQAIDIDPNSYEAYFEWGNAMLDWSEGIQGEAREKLLSESCEKYKKAIDIKPDYYQAYYNWGNTLVEWSKGKEGELREKLLGEACEKYKKTVDIEPKFYEGYQNWGATLLELAKRKNGQERDKLLNEACEKYKKVIDIKADFYGVYNNWAVALFELARGKEGREREMLYNEACEKYKKVIDLKPDFYGAYNNWGTVLIEWAKEKESDVNENLFNNACEKFIKAIDSRPDRVKAYQNWGIALQGLAYQKKGKQQENLLKEGISALMKAEELKPGTAAYNLGCSWGLLGDEDKCRKWLKIGEKERTLPKRQAALEDPALKQVRDKEWFKNIRWNDE
jgi:tetratricopeptide (TPR) repeat protein